MSWDVCDTVAAEGGFMGSPSSSQQGKHPGAHGEMKQPWIDSSREINCSWGDKPLLHLIPAWSVGWGREGRQIHVLVVLVGSFPSAGPIGHPQPCRDTGMHQGRHKQQMDG